MSVLSWQRFDIGLRLILCSGPLLVCVFSLAEFPEASGWWMLGVGSGALVMMLVAPVVAIIATRDAVWFVAVPFWAVRIAITDIASVNSVDVRPMEDFGGWGVKGASRRGGLLLAAQGQQAVRIARPNGQVFLATSGDAERAVAAIDRALGARR
ncbi:hypothetical protein KZI27_19375 [Curtobacterium sp. TC1]|uniref:hypothetical protein n=1 Tax=Curtobacterium sp. TC1 TaxID=2862880 RepID=UPI001C9B47AF|nr:hypothetical protein [Curtobacterium sp. TC1]QZQ55369.1 hypothetical protein KZI27_19375 [Curtobacterium sp. TC1]